MRLLKVPALTYNITGPENKRNFFRTGCPEQHTSATMFKRGLRHQSSMSSMTKKHNRVPSAAVAPGRTLILSAAQSTNNSACSSFVSEAPPHRRASSYLGMSLETTAEEPLAFTVEPLFDDSFLSTEPSDDYFESSVPATKAHLPRLPPLSIASYTQKFPDIEEVEVDDDALSIEEYASRVTSVYDGNDVATAVYIARPMSKPRMVDVSPRGSLSRRSSVAPSDTSTAHSRSSSYFARNSYSRKSSFSNSSDSESDLTQSSASPITPPSVHGPTDLADDEKLDFLNSDAAVVSIAKVSHIRNLSASAPKELRERIAAARSSEEQARPAPSSAPSSPAVPRRMRPLMDKAYQRAGSLDSKRPPMPPLRRSSIVRR